MKKLNEIKKCTFLDPDGPNELALCRGGPRLYNKHDIYVGGSLAHYGEFSVSESLLFEQMVGPRQIVVEVGANIGAHTVDLARLVGPYGEVHAFEPQRLVFQTLCANLALNQIGNVFTYQAGAGATAGQMSLPPISYSERANFGGVSLGEYSGGERVPVTTLDALDLPNCHFLKIDVEGMECEVLRGAATTIANYRPIMYVENDRRERSSELLSLINGLDYRAFWHLARFYNPANFAGDPRNHYVDGLVSINVLCVPNEKSVPVDPTLPRVTGSEDTPEAAGARIRALARG